MKFLVVSLIIAVSLSFSAGAEYVQLDGKWAELKGPRYWDFLAIAPTEEACQDLAYVFNWQDEKEFNHYIKSFDVIRIKNNTSVIVLDVKLFEGRAKVTLLEGLYRGYCGWVPLSWLDNNEFRPTLTKVTS